MYKFLIIAKNNSDDDMEKQIINCSVYECSFCNRNDEKCELNEIKIANQSSSKSKKGTMCVSYKKRI